MLSLSSTYCCMSCLSFFLYSFFSTYCCTSSFFSWRLFSSLISDSFFFWSGLLLPEMCWYLSSWNVLRVGSKCQIFLRRNMFQVLICDFCSLSRKSLAADLDFLSVEAMFSTQLCQSWRLLLRSVAMDLMELRCLLYLSCACFCKKWSWLMEREPIIKAYINKIIGYRPSDKNDKIIDHHNQLRGMGLLAGKAQLPVGVVWVHTQLFPTWLWLKYPQKLYQPETALVQSHVFSIFRFGPFMFDKYHPSVNCANLALAPKAVLQRLSPTAQLVTSRPRTGSVRAMMPPVHPSQKD